MRGTSGSGKSTIFRKVLDGYHRLPQFTPGRRQPFYYFFTNPAGHPDVMVLGHYETPCGGCDTIGKQHTIFEPVRLGHKLGKHVLFEGLLVSGEVVNTVQLHKDGLPLQVIALTTPVDLCIDSVNERRRRKNPDKAPPTWYSLGHGIRYCVGRHRSSPTRPRQRLEAFSGATANPTAVIEEG